MPRADGQLRNSASAAPVLVACAAMFVLTGMDALVKAAAQRHAVIDVAAARYFFGALAAVAALVLKRGALPRAAALPAYATRVVFTVSTAVLFFYSLSQLPISQAIAISFIAPALIALIARVLLGERASPMTLVSIGVSFLGVLVIGYDDFIKWKNPLEEARGFAAALAAAVTYAVSLVLLRAQTATDAIVTIVATTNVLGALALAPAAFVFGAPLDALARDWPQFLALGCFGTLGHLLIAYAYSRAPAARIGAVDYTALIWATLFGILFFNEWPSRATLAGAALIVFGAALLLVGKSTLRAAGPEPAE